MIELSKQTQRGGGLEPKQGYGDKREAEEVSKSESACFRDRCKATRSLRRRTYFLAQGNVE